MRAWFLLVALWPVSAAAQHEPVFQSGACGDAEIQSVARCGRVSVPEDRAKPDGRQIAINVMVLPATEGAQLPPLYDLDGGPGLPATKNSAFYLGDGAAYRRQRDIVLFDQRGTGQSNPLYCPDLASPDRQYALFYPLELVAACRAALSTHARLELYGTDAAADDLDQVRRALGHDRIDIVALSYGTELALRYEQRFPGRVRAMVLFGTVTPQARVPEHHAPAGQRALSLLFLACAREPACASRFPSPQRDLEIALQRLGDLSGAPARDVFLERLRSLMYAPAGARAIPLILHFAAAGDLRPFFAATRRTQPARDSDGVYLSITCAEGLATMDYAAAAQAARATVFGDYRLRRQRAACDGWPVAATAPDFYEPPRPRAAALFISGSLDPVTPPEWAEAVAQRTSNGRHIILEGGGHIVDGMSGIDTCLDPLLIEFLASAEPNALDTVCLESLRPPPFLLSPPMQWGMNSAAD